MMYTTNNDDNSWNEELKEMATSTSGMTQIFYADSRNDTRLMSGENQNEKGGLEEICGLLDIKETLRITLIYPSLFSNLFPKKIRWNKILLYGPPGTGKTLLGKAIATEMNATLHRISCVDMLSYWRLNSEEQIRKLFRHVRSDTDETIVLFFDDLNELCQTQNSDENDYVKRIKTELRAQLEEFGSNPEDFHVYILAATNCPWKIDDALKNCFQKKIYVPLPERGTRRELIIKNFDGIEISLTNAEWNQVLDDTEGYSGTDLENVVMNACCERFLEMKNCKYWDRNGDFWYPATSEFCDVTTISFDDLPKNKIIFREINFSDLDKAIRKTPMSVNQEDLSKCLEV